MHAQTAPVIGYGFVVALVMSAMESGIRWARHPPRNTPPASDWNRFVHLNALIKIGRTAPRNVSAAQMNALMYFPVSTSTMNG